VTRRRTEPMETHPRPSAEGFDGWYADMRGSPVKDEIQRRHLGLPPHLPPTSLLGWAAIAEVAEALRLSPGDTMLDVACGCGGYGLEIAVRTGARLVRVDFSAETVRQACEHAWRLGRTAGLPPRESRRDRPGRRLGRRRAMRGRDPVLPAARRRLLRATAGPWARRTCGADLLGAPRPGRRTAARPPVAGRPRCTTDGRRLHQRGIARPPRLAAL
jgi:Mycolic acid cyclopropane synthetase